MNQNSNVRIKYISVVLFSAFLCMGLLMFGGNWIPDRITQEIMLEDPIYNGGISQVLLTVEEQILKDSLALQDSVPHRYRTNNADIMVMKMSEEQKIIPYTKYRIEIRYRYPNTVFLRKTKLDAILVLPRSGINHVFADLFWSLE
jgi:hypothetical protein